MHALSVFWCVPAVLGCLACGASAVSRVTDLRPSANVDVDGSAPRGAASEGGAQTGALERAAGLERAGDLRAARAGYLQVLQSRPDDADVWTRLGNLEVLRRETELARAALERAYELGGTQPELPEAIADLHFIQGGYEDALPWYQLALKGQPKSPRIWVRLARAQSETGAYASAEASCERVLALSQDPHSRVQARELLGLIALRQGDEAAAIRRLRIAVGAGSKEPSVRAFLAVQAFSSHDFEAVLRLSEGLDVVSHTDLSWTTAVVMSLQAEGKPDEAMALLEQAEGARPGAPELERLRGQLATGFGDTLPP